MCGLVAFADLELFLDPIASMQKALESIKHRGTKDPVLKVDADHGCVLGHVRLPIQGLEEPESIQPRRSGEYFGAFVGEILNYKTLVYKAKTDVPLALDRWLGSEDSRGRMSGLEGFWAIAGRNSSEGFSACVDYIGQKPLFVHHDLLVVASELKAITAIDKDLELDEIYLSNVRKWGYDPTGGTPYKGVTRLGPGQAVYLGDDGLLELNSYYPGGILERNSIPTSWLTPANLRVMLINATMDRLVSDEPIAVLCSGGLDSTIVALLASCFLEDITVFHIENEESEYFDKIQWADHVKVRKIELASVSSEDAWDANEEPIDLGSVVPQYALGAALKKEGFRVCLTGDGADELFGGYGRAHRYDSQWSDVFCELPYYHLPRLDRTMMAHQVELRSPFLSQKIIQFALNLPYSMRIGKNILKEAFKDLVPKEILDRPKKALRPKSTESEEYRLALVDRFVTKHHQSQ